MDIDGRTALIKLCALNEKAHREFTSREGRPCAHEKVIQSLLCNGLHLQAKDNLGRTALHWAVANGHGKLVTILLDNQDRLQVTLIGGFSLTDHTNARTKKQQTPLHLAAVKGWHSIAKALLQHGADATATSDGGWTPLHNAAKEGHAEILALLIAAQASVQAITDNGRTALHWAAEQGHIDCVKLLLPHFEPILLHCKDSRGRSPWMLAARMQHHAIMGLLDPSNKVWTLSPLAKMTCKRHRALVADIHPYKHSYGANVSTQSVSIYDLLYLQSGNGKRSGAVRPKAASRKRGSFRWVHVPANNASFINGC